MRALMTLHGLDQLSAEDRLRLVEELWESLADTPELVPVIEAQRSDSKRRLDAYRENPQGRFSWEEVMGVAKVPRAPRQAASGRRGGAAACGLAGGRSRKICHTRGEGTFRWRWRQLIVCDTINTFAQAGDTGMQRPSALGLFLCDQVIVDQDSVKLTLVGLFNAIRGHDFPLTPKPFDVYAELTVDRAV